MHYFFCSLSYWGLGSKEAAHVLSRPGEPGFQQCQQSLLIAPKKQCLAGSLAYSRLGLLTKQAPISAGFSASLASLTKKRRKTGSAKGAAPLGEQGWGSEVVTLRRKETSALGVSPLVSNH